MVETENLPGSKSEIESITAVTWWGDYRDLRNKKQWNTVKILWIEFQYYSTSGPSAQAFLLLGVEELGSPPQSPTSSSLRTGANRRNASRCQEAVKCWRGGQRAFTHMWLYFHNSILPFLLFSFICSFFFSCHIFLFPDSPPPPPFSFFSQHEGSDVVPAVLFLLQQVVCCTVGRHHRIRLVSCRTLSLLYATLHVICACSISQIFLTFNSKM